MKESQYKRMAKVGMTVLWVLLSCLLPALGRLPTPSHSRP